MHTMQPIDQVAAMIMFFIALSMLYGIWVAGKFYLRGLRKSVKRHPNLFGLHLISAACCGVLGIAMVFSSFPIGIMAIMASSISAIGFFITGMLITFSSFEEENQEKS